VTVEMTSSESSHKRRQLQEDLAKLGPAISRLRHCESPLALRAIAKSSECSEEHVESSPLGSRTG